MCYELIGLQWDCSICMFSKSGMHLGWELLNHMLPLLSTLPRYCHVWIFENIQLAYPYCCKNRQTPYLTSMIKSAFSKARLFHADHTDQEKCLVYCQLEEHWVVTPMATGFYFFLLELLGGNLRGEKWWDKRNRIRVAVEYLWEVGMEG